MPSRLRPTASLAADAILVGDPGRALLLAQELLAQPKMSNHARGLWGYSGQTPAGDALTIQATGMGGPSAALVLADLAKLGVRRVVRIGTCTGAGAPAEQGGLLLASTAVAVGGSSTSFGVSIGQTVAPDPELTERLGDELGGEARETRVASFDSIPDEATSIPAGAGAADMQTVAVLARARALGIAATAVLIVAQERPGGALLSDPVLEAAAKRAGQAAATVLSG